MSRTYRSNYNSHRKAAQDTLTRYNIRRSKSLDHRTMPLTKDRITRVAHALAITRPDDSNGVWYATCQDVADGLGLDACQRSAFIADCKGTPYAQAHPRQSVNPTNSDAINHGLEVNSYSLDSWENEGGLYV